MHVRRPNDRSLIRCSSLETESPARQFVSVQIANGFSDCGDRFVVLPPEGRPLYRLAERLWKVIPMVAAKDSWRLRELSAVASQAFGACRLLSEHRSSCDTPGVSGRPTFVVGRGISKERGLGQFASPALRGAGRLLSIPACVVDAFDDGTTFRHLTCWRSSKEGGGST